MTAKTRNDILGLEYDWLAVDQEGHVAVFSTAGGGRAPQAVLENTDVHDAGLDALMALEPRLVGGTPGADVIYALSPVGQP